jgi:hypothetical protein
MALHEPTTACTLGKILGAGVLGGGMMSRDSLEQPELLYVTCRTCSSPVPTGIHLTSAVYEIPPKEGHLLTCLRCGAVASYRKSEFRILSESLER